MAKKFSLIICTYMRPEPLTTLLDSVQEQTAYPDEILIIDGSTDDETDIRFRESGIKNLQYFKVSSKHRGLTKQRNYGINRVETSTDIVCFLDDDTILKPTYFERILDVYHKFPETKGVGGYITNEVVWEKVKKEDAKDINHFYYDNYRRTEGSRFKLRRKLGLAPNTAPGILPKFGHGRPTSFLPPSGKIYEVKQLMGGVSSFPLQILKENKFSEYFQGYGLYEDADFTFRISKLGSMYIHTGAKLEHHHASSGRPNQYNYGKMVSRNGWYVWKTMYPNPGMDNILKWYIISGLLAIIRLTNVVTSSRRQEALTEFLGRLVGLLSLIFYKPKFK
ncbi:glycosyltransferase family 2 protein [Dokdonia sp. Hel_I_53]|uniref:glycosyltransferase family 2 protein n=1 Tax=Dokdonia sp. Hel_I_53 TaxID=1566287 RepID=UPI0011998DB1|nr:glycosyltransferase family A protein [Dokdonia sp. Hel_I_53]TVZ53401.1 GT2 family glycosyltransferase [Dokdonia sp. Hel_I_53]